MNIGLALIPALAWGIVPLMVSKVPHSKPTNQILGMGLGAIVVGMIVALTRGVVASPAIFLLAMLSGMFWALAQTGQFISYIKLGVAQTMPISTGLQLIGNTIIGALIFGEWQSVTEYTFGILALVLIILGVALTAISRQPGAKRVTLQNFAFLLLTTVGYWVFSTFPKTVAVSGEQLFFPQTIGILLGATLYLAVTRRLAIFTQAASYWDALAGIAFGIGALSYMLSAQVNGVTSAFIYSQLSVIISTLGGMVILGERKRGFELGATLIGLILILIGAAI